MVSISDMLKLLDQVPIWKTIKTLPGRIGADPTHHAAPPFGNLITVSDSGAEP